MPIKQTTILSTLALLAVTTFMPATNAKAPDLAVKATLKERRYKAGDEIQPAVTLVNSSDKAIDLEYLKPFVVVPEIWDASTRTRLLNAPSVIFSQMRTTQKSTLEPGQRLDLSSFYVVIEKLSDTAQKAAPKSGYRCYWYKTRPGKYFLRYRLSLKDLIRDGVGEVVSNDLPIELD